MIEKIKAITGYVRCPYRLFIALSARGFFNWMEDESYLRLKYRLRFGKKLDLKNPQTFNEKIQWLKLYDRKQEYIKMVDKYAAKEFVAEKVGKQYIIPTYGVWDRFDDIDFDILPEQFVLKCTHDSGGSIICRDKVLFDKNSAKKKLEKSLNNNYFYQGREWAYKYVRPRILAEKYMESSGKVVPEDYKVYCFQEKPKYIVVFHNRYDDTKELSETVYDVNWIPQKISLDNHFKISDETEDRPFCLKEMLMIAETLSKGMAQSRIDFYIVDNALKFGEITLYTASGMQPMIPEELDRELGKEIVLDF